MNDFEEKFKNLESDLVNEQRRMPLNSCLKVYYGITSEKQYRISFISSIRPYEFESTKELKITQGKESDEVYWTCFDLMDDEAKDVFFIFCASLIDTIDGKTDEISALDSLKARYSSWRLLLKSKGRIPYEIYQGLYGELFFLHEYLMKNNNIDVAINSWVGPEGYSKDFSINDTWYEIKTIGTSSSEVKINSLAQLDSDVDGHLVVISVEKMSKEFDTGLCSVSKLYRDIIDNITDHQLREKFINKVLKYGFVDDDNSINNNKFEVKKVNFYHVVDKFPKLTRKNVTSMIITNVSYNLAIGSLEEYKEDF